MYIIGIDGGGTKTIGVLTTAAGEQLAYVESGPANYHAVGEKETEAVLGTVVSSLYETAGIAADSAVHVCLGMAGLGRPEDRQIIGRLCDRLGISAERTLTHDAHIALVGGTGKQDGIIVISGTGAIVYGINRNGEEARASGWGYLLGDEGSGYDIALKGLQAVARAADRRGPPTELTTGLLKRLRFTEPTELVRWVHAADRRAIAALSEVVFETAETGDAVAADIIDRAAEELACATGAVIQQLGPQARFDVVLSGGNLRHQTLLADTLREQIQTRYRGATVRLPKQEPVYGAVLLARSTL